MRANFRNREPIHYAVHGTHGPFVILIHGWCGVETFWRFQIVSLSERFRLVTVDLAGHGRSQRASSSASSSIEGFADDVTAVAESLPGGSFALVGHSMGGPVAIETALRLGARCPLVLGVDTFTDAAFYLKRPCEEIEARKQVFAADFKGAMERMVRQITADDVDVAIVDWIVETMCAGDREVAALSLDGLLSWDIMARWPLLKCPVETINSAALARRTEPLDLKRLRIHEMKSAGHFPMLEAPREFDALALCVLERNGLC